MSSRGALLALRNFREDAGCPFADPFGLVVYFSTIRPNRLSISCVIRIRYANLCTILVNLHRDDLRLKAVNALVFMEDVPEVEDERLNPGDIAHSGNIRELEAFTDAWHRVFPGSEVKLMISTENHDIDAWGGRWNNFTEKDMLAQRLNYKDNLEKTWQRLFSQKWELIWRREVKGYTFVGAQWSSLNPPIGEYFRAHAAELRGAL